MNHTITKQPFLKGSLLALLLLPFFLTTACTDEETELGINLTDPRTLYNGIDDTLYANRSWSKIEDTMLTVGFSHGVVGTLNNTTFGRTTSVFYTQVALPNTSFYLSGDITKVQVTLAKERLYPDTNGSYTFNFRIRQLAEIFPADTLIYSHRDLAVESTLYCDTNVTVNLSDTLITLTLSPAFHSLIPQNATDTSFLKQMRGLCIEAIPSGSEGMMAFNLSSPKTCLTVFYHDNSTGNSSRYTMLMGAGTEHYTRFTHNYSGTPFASSDSLDGSTLLYVSPLAGPYAVLDFTSQVQAFAAAHPLATVHYAELVLPLASAQPTAPTTMLQVRRNLNGTYVPARDMMPVSSSLESLLSYNPNELVITGLIDTYLLKGFDGYYNATKNQYRMRLTQQLQQMLQKGDGRLQLVVDSRYCTGLAAVLAGTSSSTKPYLAFVFSE